MSTEAVMAHMGPEEDIQVCRIEGCGKPAVYHVVKLTGQNSEEEKFFCQEHGIEYSTRGHLVISENV
jgi:hypothetical protein